MFSEHFVLKLFRRYFNFFLRKFFYRFLKLFVQIFSVLFSSIDPGRTARVHLHPLSNCFFKSLKIRLLAGMFLRSVVVIAVDINFENLGSNPGPPVGQVLLVPSGFFGGNRCPRLLGAPAPPVQVSQASSPSHSLLSSLPQQ